MAEPTLEEQVAQIKKKSDEALKLSILKDDGLQHLIKFKEAQDRRTDLLHKHIILPAVFNYMDMRRDMLEEMLRDKGPTSWLSTIFSVAIVFIPCTAAAGLFLDGLSKSFQKAFIWAINRRLAATHQRMKTTLAEISPLLQRETLRQGALGLVREKPLVMQMSELRRLSQQFKETDDKAAEFVKKYWQDEVANKFQDGASYLADTAGKHMLKQPQGVEFQKRNTTDAPVVQVYDSVYRGLDAMITAQNHALDETKKELIQLYKRAIYYLDPWTTDRALVFARVNHPIQSEQKYQEMGKKLKEELKQFVGELKPNDEDLASPPPADQLDDLRRMIEACMWCMTYDFSIRSTVRVVAHGDEVIKKVDQYTVYEGPPLPGDTWDRLLERYTDPNEQRSFKDVGSISRLGTKKTPISPDLTKDLPSVWPPRLRLSFYFSKVLYPELSQGYDEITRKFGKLMPEAPPAVQQQAQQPEPL